MMSIQVLQQTAHATNAPAGFNGPSRVRLLLSCVVRQQGAQLMDWETRLEHHTGRALAVLRRIIGLRTEFDARVVVPEAWRDVRAALRGQVGAGVGRNVVVSWGGEVPLVHGEWGSEVEAGVEVDGPFADCGEVVGSATPSGLVAATTYRGPSDRLHEAHQSIPRWCAGHGHTPVGPWWEVFTDGPDGWSDPGPVTADVFYLLADRGGAPAEPVAADVTMDVKPRPP